MRVSKKILAGFAAFMMLYPQTGYSQSDANPKLRLTIYANGLALVDEARDIVPTKTNTLTLDRITEQMLPDSLHINLGGKAHVQEIALDSDILSQHTLLERSVGKTVRVIRINPATGEEIIKDATVLSVAGGLVLKIDDRIETSVPGRLVFSDIPADLHPRPVLSVTTLKPVSENIDARFAYLTSAFSWKAVYTAVLNESHDRMNLSARAEIISNAGIDLGNAEVSLVAGDVSRKSRAPRPEGQLMMARTMAADAAAPVPEAAVADLSAFHIYRVPGMVTLKDKGSLQRHLFGADGAKVRKVLRYTGSANVFGRAYGQPNPQQVALQVAIDNEEAHGLGKPLPAGLVRAYVRDSTGALRFVGEDRIGNTAIGAEARLNLGRAFNVTVERKQTDFRKLGDRSTEAAFTLTLRNGGKKPETVEVRENIPGDWRILEQSHNHARDGAQALWNVMVPAKGTVELSYRVQVRR